MKAPARAPNHDKPWNRVEVGDILTPTGIDTWKGKKYFAFKEFGDAALFHVELFSPFNGPDELDIAIRRAFEQADDEASPEWKATKARIWKRILQRISEPA